MIKEISVLMIETKRKHKKIDYKLLERLTKSIKEAGLIHHILVTPIEHGKYKCIDGMYRLMAYKELKRPTIPCIVIEENNDSR